MHVFSSMKRGLGRMGAAGALLAATAALLPAQQPEVNPLVPEVAASAVGEVKGAPDRATILFTVETRGATAADASAENATRTTAVLAALRSAGLSEADVGTVGYTINPNMEYDEGTRASRVVGYVARNTVRAEVREIARVGRVIDAAIRAGANQVSSLNFTTSRRDELRLEAIQTAMGRACREASTMATAAGGTLGPLVQATTLENAPYPPPMPYATRMEAQAADTPIAPGDVAVQVQVTTRWRFVPAGVAQPAGAPTCR